MGKTAKKIRVRSLLNSWEDVDQGLDVIGDLTRQKNSITDRYDAEIEKLKTRCHDEISLITLQMENRAQQIYLYAVDHLQALEVRSKALPHGTVAFHKSTELKLPKDETGVIAALKELGKKYCIEVIERVRKLMLKKETEEVILAVGGTLVKKDNFRIEIPEQVYEYDRKLKIVNTKSLDSDRLPERES